MKTSQLVDFPKKYPSGNLNFYISLSLLKSIITTSYNVEYTHKLDRNNTSELFTPFKTSYELGIGTYIN